MLMVKTGSKMDTVVVISSAVPYSSVVNIYVYNGNNINDINLAPKVLILKSNVLLVSSLYLFFFIETLYDHLEANDLRFLSF